MRLSSLFCGLDAAGAHFELQTGNGFVLQIDVQCALGFDV